MNKQMQNIIICLLAVLMMAGSAADAQETRDKLIVRYFHSITSDEPFVWAGKLCSQEFNGRLAGTHEYIKAAEWVASKFAEWKISPAGDNGTYLQWFDQPYTVVNDKGALILHILQKDGTEILKHYSAPSEYYPGMNSGSGEVTAEVVYAGYGVTAPELGYDDYKNIDVRGKIVLVNRDVPFTDASVPEYSKWVRYCYHQYKIENAVNHGAAGFLYIDGNSANPNTSYFENLIVCGIGSEPLNDIMAGTGKTNSALLSSIKESFRPASFNTGRKMTIRASTVHHPEGRSCNVAAYIEGADPALRDEVIILGAHLDAVGNAGGLLVQGGLDNASGVVEIMAAAKALAQSGLKLKRSVMFILLGSEETGLKGSKYYVDNPFFEKEKTVVFINLDCTGNGTGINISSSEDCSYLFRYFREADEKYLHRLNNTSVMGKYYGRPRLDALVFRDAGYPVMNIGITGAIKPVYYHLPGDNEEVLTPEILEDVAKLLYLSVIEMADHATKDPENGK